jgi:nucleotide-binding universal stress UspA family protein
MTEQPSGGSKPRIVVGVDGSASSEQALRWALRQAKLTGAAIDAVIAWHFPFISGGCTWPPAGVLVSEFDFRTMAERARADTVSRATDGDLHAPVTQKVLKGDAAAVLIRESAGADLLVIGSRGHGGFAEALLGSVGQHCVHHAACPVVIIRGDVRTAVPTATPAPAQQPCADGTTDGKEESS